MKQPNAYGRAAARNTATVASSAFLQKRNRTLRIPLRHRLLDGRNRYLISTALRMSQPRPTHLPYHSISCYVTCGSEILARLVEATRALQGTSQFRSTHHNQHGLSPFVFKEIIMNKLAITTIAAATLIAGAQLLNADQVQKNSTNCCCTNCSCSCKCDGESCCGSCNCGSCNCREAAKTEVKAACC